MNHYPHHIGDFAKKTKGLSLTERGAYRELLDQYYVHEKPLPLDKREVYRMAVAATPAERKAVDYVLGKYFVEKPDGWHQKRCDEEIVLYRKRAETARHNGTLGGRRRGENGTDRDTESDTQRDSSSDPSGIPSANLSGKLAVNQEPKTNAVSSESPPKTPPRTPANGGQNGLKGKTAASFADWRVNDRAAELKAASLGIHANRGETYTELRQRIAQAEAQKQRAT